MTPANGNVTIFLGAVKHDDVCAWESLLVAGKSRKRLGGLLENASLAEAYLHAAIESLKILAKTCTISICSESGYLYLTVNRFIPNHRSINWEDTSDTAVLMKNLDIITERHVITWKFREIGSSRVISKLYSRCSERILQFNEQKVDLL